MKAIGLGALVVNDDGHSGNEGSTLPEITLLPLVRKARGFDKENVGSQSPLRMGHDRGEFPNRGSRAGTMRMRQDNQGWTVPRRLNFAVGRPLVRCRGRFAWRTLVIPECPKAQTNY